MSLTPFEYERALRKMVTDYETALRDEWKHRSAMAVKMNLERGATMSQIAATLQDDMRGTLVREIYTNRSTSSGGHSVTNLCEQIRREVASELLNISWMGTWLDEIMALGEKYYKTPPKGSDL